MINGFWLGSTFLQWCWRWRYRHVRDSFHKAEAIYCFIGQCQVKVTAITTKCLMNFAFLFALFFSWRKKTLSLSSFFITQCVLLVYGLPLLCLCRYITAIYSRKLRKVFKMTWIKWNRQIIVKACTRDVRTGKIGRHTTSNYDGYAKCKWMSYINKFPCVQRCFFLGLSLFFSFLRSESFITFWYSQLKSTKTKHTCGARCTFSLILYIFWIVSTAASVSRIGEYGNKWREKHIYTFRSWQNAMKQTARVKFMLQNELRSTTWMQTKSSQAIKKAQEFNSARFYSQLLLLSYVIIIILW